MLVTSTYAWREARPMLSFQQELSTEAGGASQGKDLGPAVWKMDFRSIPYRHDKADQVMAAFRRLHGVTETFLASPVTRPRPVSTKGQTGAIAGVTISEVGVDGRSLGLTGLPANFTITDGDYFSVATAVGIEFLQCNETVVADGSGLTTRMDVAPYVRQSIVVGNAVTLVNPPIEMRLVPGTLDDPSQGITHRSIVFSASQVIR